MAYKLLIINPGSTSTKIGVYEDEKELFEETLRHTTEELAGFNLIVEQKDFRKKVILDILAEKNFDIKTLDVCVGRGGMLKPIPGGTYPVSDELLEDLLGVKILGVKTIWYEQEINNKWKKKEEILMEPDYKIKSMKEILNIVHMYKIMAG